MVMGKNPAQEKVGTMAKNIGLVFKIFSLIIFYQHQTGK